MLQSLIGGFRWLFSATVPAGRLFGIPLRVHVLLILMMPWMARDFFGAGENLAEAAASFLLYVSILYGSVVAHEFGHAWGHRLVGGETEMVLLWPLGGLAYGSGAGESPRAELIVVALGPAVSLVLAIAGHLAVWGLGGVAADGAWFPWAVKAARLLAWLNTIMLAFNLLLPVFPLDGARLLRAVLSLKFDPHTVTMRLCNVGIALGVVLVGFWLFRIEVPLLGAIGGFAGLVSVFGILSCLQEKQRAQYESIYRRQDTWGSRTVFYDGEIMAGARSRAGEDLGGLLKSSTRKVPARIQQKRPSGPARVIDIAAEREPEPEQMTDRAAIVARMRDAANSENFPLAARLKKRLREIDEAAPKG